MAVPYRKQKLGEASSKNSGRQFQNWWTEMYGVIERSDKAICVICSVSVVSRTSSVKRHYETIHKELLGKSRDEQKEYILRAIKNKNLQSSALNKFVNSNVHDIYVGNKMSTTIAVAEFNMNYLSQDEATALDEELFNEYKYSVDQLMELAGLSCASAIRMTYDPDKFAKVLVVCGPGNNGGDGLVAARHLALMGFDPQLYYPKRPPKPLYQNLTHQCLKHGLTFLEDCPNAASIDSNFNIVVDALFGFSFKPPVRPEMIPLMTALAETKTACCSIDIPSGWDVNSGPPSSGLVITPSMLVSLSAPKICAKYFKGIHYLGGRFIPPGLMNKYKLNLPNYPLADQCVRL